MGNNKEVRTCNRCKIEKPLTDFYKQKDRKSGYAYCCKKCYKYNKKHPDVTKQVEWFYIKQVRKLSKVGHRLCIKLLECKRQKKDYWYSDGFFNYKD